MSYNEDFTGCITNNKSAAHIPAALKLLAKRKRVCNMNLSLIFVMLICRTVWTICIGDHTA